MADKYASSTSNMTAVDSNNQEHIVTQTTVSQSLSKPDTMRCTLLAASFDIEDQLGQSITIKRYFNQSDNNTINRCYNGIITAIKHLGMDANLENNQYEITIKSWLWLLKHTHSFRVYQNQSTQEIVSDIFDNAGFKGSYQISSMPSTKREYCLQYNESDFDFITRLLAEEGVQYYFEHSENAHTLVLQDAQTPFEQASNTKFDMRETPSGDYPLIEKWNPISRFHGASIELTSYDYSQSKLVSGSVKKSSHSIANHTQLTRNRYPELGISGDTSDLASNLAKRRVEQMEQNYLTIEATAKHDAFTIATWFSLASHLDKTQLSDYSVIELNIHYDQTTECQTQLRLVPKSTPYYPTVTGKQKVHGLQSATVAGSTTGEVNQDEQGRVRIQFHWDTEASGDKTSCYVRVAQMLAGSGYGAQFIPRAGQEVLVAFIDGDPDQPIITGSVYNSKNAPPYAEANTTKSGFKTQLSGQSNELYFDDKQDNELLYLHAAKDLTQEVENNQTETIKGELTQTVTNAITVSTEDNYNLTSSKTLAEKAKTVTIEADDSLELKVGSSKITLSSSSISIEATNIDVKASSALNIEGTNVTSKATAANKLTGATMAVEASSSNSISGLSVSIKADTTLSAEGSLSAEFKSGLKATFDGGVMGEVKGAIVKVN